MNRKQFASLLKESFNEWRNDNVNLRSGALAFFIILPLPSMLFIIIEIFAHFFGQTVVLQQLIEQVNVIAGPALANLLVQILESAKNPFTSIFATITVVGFSLGGAIGAYQVLHDTMDFIWEVKHTSPEMKSLKGRIRRELRPFTVITVLALTVISWTITVTLIFRLIGSVLVPVTGSFAPILLIVLQHILSFILAIILFAMIYQEVPDIKVTWGDVKIGAAITALVFTITNALFGWYIQNYTVASIAGAAGALMILLLWIYLINQFIFFGAEFSKTYAIRYGSLHKKTVTQSTPLNEPRHRSSHRRQRARPSK